MVYQSSEARRIDVPTFADAADRLNVLEGGGLDQMARRSASPTFLKAAICADDRAKEAELMKAFHASFRDGKI